MERKPSKKVTNTLGRVIRKQMIKIALSQISQL